MFKQPTRRFDIDTNEPKMQTSTLKSLFGYKSWANAELFDLLGTLQAQHPEQLHTCIRTLNHIYVVDRLFRARLSGEASSFDSTNTEATWAKC